MQLLENLKKNSVHAVQGHLKFLKLLGGLEGCQLEYFCR